ncbi:MAG: structural protein [Gammaproteobacteria bacterium]|nr:structural protein [Gammaproteobacteria bacterium]
MAAEVDGVKLVNGRPRGIRNNNPGNIRTEGTPNGVNGADPWRGLQGHDEAGYGIFEGPGYGIRAMGKLLDTYRDRYGLETVEEIIGRWAPPVENDTEAYIRHVAQRLDVPRDHPLTDAQRPALVEAIIAHENGQQPYSRAFIEGALAL